MLSSIVFISALITLTVADSDSNESNESNDVTLELLGTYTIPAQSESAEYDSLNKVIYFVNRPQGTVSILDASDLDSILDGSALLTEDAFDLNGFTLISAGGMYTDGTTLYINSIGGNEIILFDINDQEAFDSYPIAFDNDNGARVNGLCVDPNNNNIAYVTDAGITRSTSDSGATVFTNNGRGMIYQVNLDTGDYTKIYDASEDSSDNYNINPNGCIVDEDSILYVVERKIDGTTPQLIVYDIENESFDFFDINGNNDGIIVTNNGNLFYSDNVTDGKIYRIIKNACDSSSSSSNSSGSSSDSDDSADICSIEFSVALEGIQRPADLGFNFDDNIIIAPTFDAGILSFIKVNE